MGTVRKINYFTSTDNLNENNSFVLASNPSVPGHIMPGVIYAIARTKIIICGGY